MTTVRAITSAHDVRELVDALVSPERERVIVVISTQMREAEPLMNARTVADALADCADTYIIRTGSLTYDLGDLLPGRDTHVYGGAARIYPAGRDWVENARLAPMVFCYPDQDPRQREARVIYDAKSIARRSVVAATGPGPRLGNSIGELFGDLLRGVETVVESQPIVPTPTAPLPAPPRATVVTAAAAPRPGAALPGPGLRSRVDLAEVIETQPAPSHSNRQALQNALQSLDTARARVGALERQLQELEQGRELSIREATRDIRAELGEAEYRLRLEREGRSAKVNDAIRRAASAARPAGEVSVWQPENFASLDQAVHHALLLTWVERVPAADKASLPLCGYVLGRDFAPSIMQLDRPQAAKAFRAAIDVITRLVEKGNRRPHPLRTSEVGGAPARTREDGAVAWRADVESKTAAARRIHWWKLPDGTVELARVVVHDDFGI